MARRPLSSNLPSPRIPALLAALVLLGCGAPLPEERHGYAGQWDGERTSLRITLDGFVSYERQAAAGRVHVDGPIRGFQGDDFSVGLPLIQTTFRVERRPWFEKGRWRMVVDGTELVRSPDTGAPRSADVGAPSIEILDAGVFGPQRRDGSRGIVESTTRIPAAVGRSFGVWFAYHDPDDATRVLTFRWDIPPIRDPRAGRVQRELVVHSAVEPRGTHWVSADFETRHDLVGGRWTLSVLDGERLITRKAFQVHVP